MHVDSSILWSEHLSRRILGSFPALSMWNVHVLLVPMQVFPQVLLHPDLEWNRTWRDVHQLTAAEYEAA